MLQPETPIRGLPVTTAYMDVELPEILDIGDQVQRFEIDGQEVGRDEFLRRYREMVYVPGFDRLSARKQRALRNKANKRCVAFLF